MYFFKPAHEAALSKVQQSKLYLADRLIEDIDKAFSDKSKNNLRSIKSAIVDIVVLEKILNRIGFSCSLEGDLKEIRNSLAHIDERMDKFTFKPIKLEGFKVSAEEANGKFKKSVSINFQGAVDQAGIALPISNDGPSSVNAVSLFGMVDDRFLWVDKSGSQRVTKVETINNCYKQMLNMLGKKNV